MLLKHHGAIGARPIRAAAIEFDRTLDWLEHPGGDVEQRALSASTGSDDNDEFTGRAGQAHIFERLDLGTGKIDVDAMKRHLPANAGLGRATDACRRSRR